MKTTFIIFFSLPLIAFGQTSQLDNQPTKEKLNYEFGFNLYSLTGLHKNSINNKINYKLDNHFFSGLFLKYYLKQNIIRLSIDYYQNLINEEWKSDPWYSTTKGEYRAGEIKIGYERQLSKKKLVPFIHTDFCYNYSQSNGLSTVYGDIVWFTDKPFLIKKNEFSLSAGLGLKYYVSKNIILTYEFNAQSGYEYIREDGSSYRNYLSMFNPIRQFGLSIKL